MDWSQFQTKVGEPRKRKPNFRPLTLKQKLFCEYVHAGNTPNRAAHLAGYSPSRWRGWLNMKSPNIRARLHKLEERAMRKHDITIEKALTDLEKAKDLAAEGGQPSAMVNATMAQAKIVGLVVDKVERKEIKDMEVGELREAVQEVFGDKADIALKALGLAEKKEAEWKDFPATGTVQ